MAQMMLLASSGPFSSPPPTAAHPNLPSALSVIVVGAGGTGECVTGGGGSGGVAAATVAIFLVTWCGVGWPWVIVVVQVVDNLNGQWCGCMATWMLAIVMVRLPLVVMVMTCRPGEVFVIMLSAEVKKDSPQVAVTLRPVLCERSNERMLKFISTLNKHCTTFPRDHGPCASLDII